MFFVGPKVPQHSSRDLMEPYKSLVDDLVWLFFVLMFRFWWCVPFFTAQVFDNDGIVVKATGLAVWEVALQQPTHGRLDRQLLRSWVTWCFLRLAFLQVTCFFLWLAFFDQVMCLVFFF